MTGKSHPKQPEDFFEEMLKARGGLSAGEENPQDPQRGDDLRYVLEISLEEAAKGGDREISITKKEKCDLCQGGGADGGRSIGTCPTCGGIGKVSIVRLFVRVSRACPACRGEKLIGPCKACGGGGWLQRNSKVSVRIPPGVDNGFGLRLSGKGDAGLRGGPPGDLHIAIRVKAHDIFERQGDDLLCSVPITAAQAEVEVPSLDGRLRLKLPPGAAPGTVLRLRGKGISRIDDPSVTGDMHVRLEAKL